MALRQEIFEQAEKYYEACLKIGEELFNKYSVDAERIAAYLRLGSTLMRQGNYPKAEKLYHTIQNVLKEFAERVKTEDARIKYASSYGDLGTIARFQGKFSEAEDYFVKSLEMAEEIFSETQSAKALANFKSAYSMFLGLAGYSLNSAATETDEGNIKYFDSKEKKLKLWLGNGKFNAWVDKKYKKWARALRQAQKQSKDLEQEIDCEKELEVYIALNDKNNTVESRRVLALVYYGVGVLLYRQNKLSEAEDYYNKALNIITALVEDIGEFSDCRLVSNIYMRLGLMKNQTNDTSKSQHYLEHCLKIRTDLASKCSADESQYFLDLAFILRALGYMEYISLSQRISYINQSISVLEKIKETDTAFFNYFVRLNGDLESLKQVREYLKSSSKVPSNLKSFKVLIEGSLHTVVVDKKVLDINLGS